MNSQDQRKGAGGGAGNLWHDIEIEKLRVLDACAAKASLHVQMSRLADRVAPVERRPSLGHFSIFLNVLSECCGNQSIDLASRLSTESRDNGLSLLDGRKCN